VRCDWETLIFANGQKKALEANLAELAAGDPRVPLLIQLQGIGLMNAITILAAIGPIERFPTAKKLVGYAGLGARVKEIGESRLRGGIIKAGRKDLRSAMVTAASHAIRHYPYWKKEYERMVSRKGRPKTLVAIGRRMLVVVWHLLTGEAKNRRADPRMVACSLYKFTYDVGVKKLPDGQSALEFTRNQLDRLKIGPELTRVPWGTRQPKLPPSRLPSKRE
jgi:transposase